VHQANDLIAEVESFGGMISAIQAGIPKARIERSATERQVRIDRGEDVIVGVNAYAATAATDVEVLVVDNTAVRSQQLNRLQQVKASRDKQRVQQSLEALRQAARSDGNLLAAAVECARLRATVGEISEALVDVFTRYEATTMTIEGVYGAGYADDPEYARVHQRVVAFGQTHGRRPRILIAKLGQDGHDRGAKVIATAFADLGFDVDIGPLFSTPEEAARLAADNDVHVVGISSQAAGHRTLVPELLEALKAAEAPNVLVVVGGVIPPKDVPDLLKQGVALVFGPGTNVLHAADEVLHLLESR
jgi:methylmalonyl-CoA mutase